MLRLHRKLSDCFGPAGLPCCSHVLQRPIDETLCFARKSGDQYSQSTIITNSVWNWKIGHNAAIQRDGELVLWAEWTPLEPWRCSGADDIIHCCCVGVINYIVSMDHGRACEQKQQVYQPTEHYFWTVMNVGGRGEGRKEEMAAPAPKVRTGLVEGKENFVAGGKVGEYIAKFQHEIRIYLISHPRRH